MVRRWLTAYLPSFTRLEAWEVYSLAAWRLNSRQSLVRQDWATLIGPPVPLSLPGLGFGS